MLKVVGAGVLELPVRHIKKRHSLRHLTKEQRTVLSRACAVHRGRNFAAEYPDGLFLSYEELSALTCEALAPIREATRMALLDAEKKEPDLLKALIRALAHSQIRRAEWDVCVNNAICIRARNQLADLFSICVVRDCDCEMEFNFSFLIS